jgi:hypothetical protein
VIIPERELPLDQDPVSRYVPVSVSMKAVGIIHGTNYTLYKGNHSSKTPVGSPSEHPYDVCATGPGLRFTTTCNLWDDISFASIGGWFIIEISNGFVPYCACLG